MHILLLHHPLIYFKKQRLQVCTTKYFLNTSNWWILMLMPESLKNWLRIFQKLRFIMQWRILTLIEYFSLSLFLQSHNTDFTTYMPIFMIFLSKISCKNSHQPIEELPQNKYVFCMPLSRINYLTEHSVLCLHLKQYLYIAVKIKLKIEVKKDRNEKNNTFHYWC